MVVDSGKVGYAEGDSKIATDPVLIEMAHEMQLDAADRLRAGFPNTSDSVEQLHPSNWNLDRLDQRSLPLDRVYR